MHELDVRLPSGSYPVHIASDYAGLGVCNALSGRAGRMVVVTDTNVNRHYAQTFIDGAKANGWEIYKFVMAAGEKSKSLDTVESIYKYLIGLGPEKSMVLAALGGGVVGDVTGFAAATFFRGLDFIQVPTSLLAQVDSSIGGKVGVNFQSVKNAIGAFYQPKLVYINIDTLKTLPQRELKSGLAEVIAHGVIGDGELLDFIGQNTEQIYSFNQDAIRHVVEASCEVKVKVIEKDEKEHGLRAILNFGHTIGHALESVCDFRMLHGECVSVGMAGAFKIAHYLGMIDGRAGAGVTKILENIGLPVSVKGMDVDKVYNQMLFDKKIKNSRLVFILPTRAGRVVPCTVDNVELIKKVLRELAA